MTELEATLTPVTLGEIAGAFLADLADLRGAPASFDELVLAVSHSALETGYWRALRAFNVGNSKATEAWCASGRDWTYYECGEEFSQAYARNLAASSPLITIVREYSDARGMAMASIVAKPKHPICRFRAFATLAAGVRSHLQSLRDAFPKSWASLATDDASAFVHALRSEGYFTADPEIYLHGADGRFGLAAIVREITAKLPPIDAATGEIVCDNPGDEIVNVSVAEDTDATS